MKRPSRLVKRLIAPALLIAALVVAVQAVLAAPQPSFTYSVAAGAPATGCKTVNFTSTSTDPDDPETDVEQVDWDFDNDGNFGDASGTTASHVFAKGTHQVGIRATDTDGTGGAVSATQPVDVTNSAPGATIDVPATVQAGVSAQYTATGADSDGSVASYAWDFDGNLDFNDGTGATASHTYPAAGPQTVRVRVTDNCGDTGVGQAPVTVAAAQAPPIPSFTMKVGTTNVDTVNPGVEVDFASTSTDPNNDPLTYSWSLDGDNVFDDGTTASVKKTYPTFPNVKVVRVRLRVSDGQGSPVETFLDLRINKAPFGAFTVSPVGPLINESVAFDASSSFDFEGPIATYEWDFNYGGTPATFATDATGVTTSHAFATAGSKSVALRVTDADGGVTVAPRTVEVQLSRPNAGLTFSPENPLPGQAVTLTSTSTPSASPSAPALIATQWDLDYSPIADFTLDGAGGSIVTSFALPGPHTVAVKVIETGGGFAIASATINVNAPPVASFTVTPAKPLEGREVTFASTSSDPDGPIVKQEWDLDNDAKYERQGGVVSTSSLKRGTRTIRLRVTDSKGATSVAAVPVNIGAKPLKDPVRIRRSIGFARHTWGIRLVALLIKVPRQTTVTVRCKGRGCPSGTFKKRTRKKAGTLVFDKLKGSLRAGAKITVYTTHPGHVSRFDTYIVRGKSRAPLLREQCKYPGKKRPRACP